MEGGDYVEYLLVQVRVREFTRILVLGLNVCAILLYIIFGFRFSSMHVKISF